MSRSKAHGRNVRAHVDEPIAREIRRPTAAGADDAKWQAGLAAAAAERAAAATRADAERRVAAAERAAADAERAGAERIAAANRAAAEAERAAAAGAKEQPGGS